MPVSAWMTDGRSPRSWSKRQSSRSEADTARDTMLLDCQVLSQLSRVGVVRNETAQLGRCRGALRIRGKGPELAEGEAGIMGLAIEPTGPAVGGMEDFMG